MTDAPDQPLTNGHRRAGEGKHVPLKDQPLRGEKSNRQRAGPFMDKNFNINHQSSHPIEKPGTDGHQIAA